MVQVLTLHLFPVNAGHAGSKEKQLVVGLADGGENVLSDVICSVH
jgi:hypothetical protein